MLNYIGFFFFCEVLGVGGAWGVFSFGFAVCYICVGCYTVVVIFRAMTRRNYYIFMYSVVGKGEFYHYSFYY